MNNTLPAGWVGNLAHHHTTRGVFTLTVARVSRPAQRFGWSLAAGHATIAHSDHLGHADAATARAAALARLVEIVGEADESPVPLTAADLPESHHEWRICIWVPSGRTSSGGDVHEAGRPVVVRAYQSGGRLRITPLGSVYPIGTTGRDAFVERDDVVYPESAAPALWRAFLRGAR